MDTDQIIDDLIEKLAGIEHARWAKWQYYLHNKATKQADGSLVIPADLVARWERQIETPYCELSEEEKESDREQVRSYTEIIKSALRIEKNRYHSE
ncbi:hypothetical protein K7H91_11790 [Martelella mediterranea]|uniref:hypothetical protein n=1 Tax=Martelella mediterranea TaxID=293089 RepID=UPI001E497205|nr:hypothetical protein [Martelella mediterranea]MCD1634453.1 hypothetical protein [Martelella mediterranea]